MKSKRPQRARGVRTRESILRVAVDLASVEGLGGLTIGRLADELEMSKSGLFAHFGSKLELQLATIEMARQIFNERVIQPALQAPKGMPRLWSLCDLWLNYVEKKVFIGGCFFTAAGFEFDSRPGLVRDQIAAALRAWLDILTRAAQVAKDEKHLKSEIDPAVLAFEIDALAIGGYRASELLHDRTAMSRVRTAILQRLQSVATKSCPRTGSKLA